MKIIISSDPATLLIPKESLTESEESYIKWKGTFERVEIIERQTFYRVNGKKQHLFDFLYQISATYDIDMV